MAANNLDDIELPSLFLPAEQEIDISEYIRGINFDEDSGLPPENSDLPQLPPENIHLTELQPVQQELTRPVYSTSYYEHDNSYTSTNSSKSSHKDGSSSSSSSSNSPLRYKEPYHAATGFPQFAKPYQQLPALPVDRQPMTQPILVTGHGSFQVRTQ